MTRPSTPRVVAALVAALGAGLVAFWTTAPAAPTEVPGPAAHDPFVVAASRPTPGPTGSPGAPVPAPPSPSAVRPAVGTHDASPTARGSGSRTAPSTLRIPRIDASMRIVPVGVAEDGQMALPGRVTQVGWYRWGPAPGDPVGATVLAGHLDMRGQGTGPLARLGDLRRGDVVDVRIGTRTIHYAVDRVVAVRKTALDLDMIFRRDGPAALHIVTCGGTFDETTRHYDDNVVVVALPVR